MVNKNIGDNSKGIGKVIQVNNPLQQIEESIDDLVKQFDDLQKNDKDNFYLNSMIIYQIMVRGYFKAYKMKMKLKLPKSRIDKLRERREYMQQYAETHRR